MVPQLLGVPAGPPSSACKIQSFFPCAVGLSWHLGAPWRASEMGNCLPCSKGSHLGPAREIKGVLLMDFPVSCNLWRRQHC